jgi:hypothetical protein
MRDKNVFADAKCIAFWPGALKFFGPHFSNASTLSVPIGGRVEDECVTTSEFEIATDDDIIDNSRRAIAAANKHVL